MYERIAQLDLFAAEAVDATPTCGREAVAADEAILDLHVAAGGSYTEEALVSFEEAAAEGRRAFADGESAYDPTPVAPVAVSVAEVRAPWVPTHPTAFRRWLWEHLSKQAKFPRSYRPLAWEAVRDVAAGKPVPAWICKSPEHIAIVRRAARWYAAQ